MKMQKQESKTVEKVMIDDSNYGIIAARRDDSDYVDDDYLGNIMRNCCYPAPFVKHPDIGHVHMTEKLFPHMQPRVFNFEEYMKCYQITYLMLSKDFDNYISYLNDKFWEDFFHNKKRHSRI